MKDTKKVLVGTGLAVGASWLCQQLVFWKEARKEKESGTCRYSSSLGKIEYMLTGGGRPLLLLHDMCAGGGRYEWKKNVEELSKHFRVYALDWPGFGDSQKEKTTYTAFLYARALCEFIREVVGRPVQVAVSGGVSGAAVATAYHLSPESFHRILFLSPDPAMTKYPRNANAWRRRIYELPVLGTSLYLFENSKINCRKRLEKQMLYHPHALTKTLWQDMYHASHLGGAKGRFAYASCLSCFTQANILDMLPSQDESIAVIWGEYAHPQVVDTVDSMVKRRPACHWAEIENSRKWPHWEQPEAVNELMLRFFKTSEKK